jgi:hypothetical protein
MINNKTWFDIFHWREFVDYLTAQELIELSMGCKQLRSKLSYSIFKSFNFYFFTSANNYESHYITPESDYYYYNISTYLDNLDGYQSDDSVYIEFDLISNPYIPLTENLTKSRTKFKHDLSKLRYQPEILRIIYVRDYYHLIYDLPNAFCRVKALTIRDSIVLFEAFQYLLDNLKQLEDLEITSNNLLLKDQGSKNYSIIWPLTLKKLKYYNNNISNINENDSTIVLGSNESIGIQYNYLKLEPYHIPNLLVLDYQPESDTDDGSELLMFLKANPHIKKLILPLCCFKFELIKILKKFNNLTELNLIDSKIKFFRYENHLSESINPTVFCNLRQLILSLERNCTVLDTLAKQFPYVLDLTIKASIISFSTLILSISQFSSLKTLRLEVNLENSWTEKLKISNFENLEKLEFAIGYNNELAGLQWGVENCPKLKIIVFFSSYVKNFKNLKLNPDLTNRWKKVCFPCKLSLYRI